MLFLLSAFDAFPAFLSMLSGLKAQLHIPREWEQNCQSDFSTTEIINDLLTLKALKVIGIKFLTGI